MKQDANEGLGKVFWAMGITIVFLVALAAILWWYDGYMLKP